MTNVMIDANVPWYASIKEVGVWKELPGLNTTTSSLEISSSLYSLFTVGEWNFFANPSMVEEGLFSVGKELKFTFLRNKEPTSVELSILSVSNGPGVNNISLQQGMSLSLVSPWYFYQVLRSKAYKGSTATIVSQVLKSSTYSFNSIKIEDSYDTPAIRYQTIQSDSSFLVNRVYPYSIGKDKQNMYMFVDQYNNFSMINHKSIMDTTPIICIDSSSPHLAAYRGWMEDASLSKNMLYPNGYTLNINKTEEKNLWNLVNPTLLFNYPTGSSISMREPSKIDSFGFNSKNQFSLVNEHTTEGFGTAYLDTSNRTHTDILTYNLNKHNRELLNAHRIDLSCLPNLNVKPGQRLRWHLIKPDSDELSLYSQDYIVMMTSHLFQGNTASTLVTFGTPAFVYNKVTEVLNLYHSDLST